MSNYTKMSNDDLVAELILRDRAIKDIGRTFADSKEKLKSENKHLKDLQKDMDKQYQELESRVRVQKGDLETLTGASEDYKEAVENYRNQLIKKNRTIIYMAEVQEALSDEIEGNKD